MKESRNPFRLRTSEHIDQDATFLRLFEPGILDVFSSGDLWSRVRLVRSAAGAGKTSLLRLFTPSCLLTLHSHRKQDDWSELYQRLRDLEAIDESGPRVLGVMLQCGRYYATLADLSGERVRRERLFLGLLNARITLAALRGAIALKKLDFPASLSRLRIEPASGTEAPPGLELPCRGDRAYEWARAPRGCRERRARRLSGTGVGGSPGARVSDGPVAPPTGGDHARRCPACRADRADDGRRVPADEGPAGAPCDLRRRSPESGRSLDRGTPRGPEK